MKRILLAISAVCLLVTSAFASDKYFQVENDFYQCAISSSQIDSVVYSKSDATLDFHYKDGHCVWAKDAVGYIDVTESPCDESFTDSLHLSSLVQEKISGLDKVTESVPVEKDDPEYEDFIEKFLRACNVTVKWNNNKAEVSVNPSDYGVSASVNGTDVILTITDKKVRIVLSGETVSGSLKIYSDYKFRLDLDGVSIYNPFGPAINIQSKNRVYLNLPANKSNILKSGAEYVTQYGPGGEEDAKATLFSEGQLVFSGEGSLTVESPSHHGICSDDYIRFRSTLGDISVNAGKDAVHAKDYFLMYGGRLTAVAADNGIQVEKGYAAFYGGMSKIQSDDNGVETKSELTHTAYVLVAGNANLDISSKEGSAIDCQDGFYSNGGNVRLQTGGAGGRGIRSKSKIVVENGFLAVELSDCKPVWNENNQDFTQPAALRSSDSIIVSNALCSCCTKYDTQGAKVINADSAVVISNSVVAVEAMQDDYENNEFDIKAKAVEGNDIAVLNKSMVYISARKNALCSENSVVIGNSAVKLLSDSFDKTFLKYNKDFDLSGAIFYNKLVNE